MKIVAVALVLTLPAAPQKKPDPAQVTRWTLARRAEAACAARVK